MRGGERRNRGLRRRLPTGRRPRAVTAAALGLLVANLVGGCTAPVQGDLDEREANQLLVALDEAGIVASKVADSRRGHFRVEVARDDVARALRAVEARGLPRPSQPGYERLLDAPGLISSPSEERARWLVTTAGELARTLEVIDGVRTARVHLDPVAPGARLDAVPSARHAVVLLERRRGAPPLDPAQVQRLVAGAVHGLEPTSVQVEQVEASSPPRPPASLVSVGPVHVASADASALRLLLGAALTTNAVLALALGVLLWRRRRQE